MSEEKNRNYKTMGHDVNGSESIPSFLSKTYDILENPKYNDIICWTKNGEGFVVKKIKEFAESILPTHFRHSNYTSFVRQLNMYDFHKTRQENQQNAFKNVMFKRGNRHLLKEIQRKDYKKKKETKVQALEKTNGFSFQGQSNTMKVDKKTEYIKEFYEKSVSTISCLNQKLEECVSSLASIRQIDIINGKQCCFLLDILWKAKNMNKNSSNKLSHFSSEWQSFLKISKRIMNERKEQKKNQQIKNSHLDHETYPSFKSIEKK